MANGATIARPMPAISKDGTEKSFLDAVASNGMPPIHPNAYETNSHLHGNPISGAYPLPNGLNVNTESWGTSLVHAGSVGSNGIAASPQVQADLKSAIESHVPKY